MKLANARGQAMLELALFGSVAIAALAFMINVGLRMNYQQEIEQQTFRRALKIAQDEHEDEESPSVTVYQIRNRQLPNVAQGGVPIRPRTQTQASSTVTWHEHLTLLESSRSEEPRTVVQLDDAPAHEYRAEDFIKLAKGTEDPCSFDYYRCVRGCAQRNKGKGCYRSCRDQDEAACEATPLVKNIHNTLESEGEARLSDTSSSARADTRHTSTITLNTKRDEELSSTLRSRQRYDW